MVADWHTHSIFSDGLGTVRDNARAAAAAGLESLAVTDHGPAAATAGVWREETLLRLIKRAADAAAETGLEVLCGVEANVVGVDGQLDVSDEIYRRLDILAVGLHRGLTVSGGSGTAGDRVKNTDILVACLTRHPVDVITHPGHMFQVDLDALASAARLTGTALEVNSRHGAVAEQVLYEAAKHGVVFWCGSDAHHPRRVGDVQAGMSLARRAGLTPCMVANTKAAFESTAGENRER